MHLLGLVLVTLYAVLNLALAVAAVAAAARPVPGTSTRDRLPSTTLFAVGGICLLAGATTRAWPVVAAGLVGASLAALVYGITVERHTQPLHHAVRAALAAGIMALWLQT